MNREKRGTVLDEAMKESIVVNTDCALTPDVVKTNHNHEVLDTLDSGRLSTQKQVKCDTVPRGDRQLNVAFLS
ncbi:unnamed protein product [Toxocara canis]|uniref:Uncharacterized protein n=1 Tax=Toxocara canis TaxID=6265 RepID=A0A183USZ5_TOXCA|nr:unnamed protein product [Toxocara canis]